MPQAISRPDFWSFSTELVTRNLNLGIPALEDGLFANLLIFDNVYYIFVQREGTKRRGNHLYCDEGKEARGHPATKL